MTYTYLLSDDVGKVRLVIGDNIVTSYHFQDEELTYFLTEAGNSINLASAAALESWAASYATNADNERIGDYSYTQSIVDKMLALAAKLKAGVFNSPAMDIASMNLTGEEEEE